MASEMGEPGLLRPRWWLRAVVIGWLAGATLYWWRCVPAVPERVISLKPGQSLAGHTADGLLVLATAGAVEMVSPHFVETGDMAGPFEVVDPLSGESLTTVGNETWILRSDVHGSDLAVIEAGDQREVVNLRTGRTMLSRPVSADDYFDLSKDGRLLAVASREKVSMIDVGTGAQLWSREFPSREPIWKKDENLPLVDSYAVPTQHGPFTLVDFETRGRGSAMPYVEDDYVRDGLWLNSRTGETESRLKDVLALVESPDGRYVLIQKGEESQLLSLAENRVLFRIPVAVFQYEFNRDSTEVRQLAETFHGLKLFRWSIPDGKATGSSTMDPAIEPLDGCVSEDGRRFASWESDSGLLELSGLFEALIAIGVADLVDSLIPLNESAVLRTANGRWTHLLARHSSSSDGEGFPNVSVTSIGKVDQFAVTAPGRVLIFRFDPPRNWWWLAGWGLGPVVVVIGALQWRAHRRGTLHRYV